MLIEFVTLQVRRLFEGGIYVFESWMRQRNVAFRFRLYQGRGDYFSPECDAYLSKYGNSMTQLQSKKALLPLLSRSSTYYLSPGYM